MGRISNVNRNNDMTKREFVEDLELYSENKKEEQRDRLDRIESNSWGDSYPPNMTDSWARELGII